MTTCKGCGSSYRTGTLAFLLTADGLKGSRVCSACSSRAIRIVPVLVTPIVEQKPSRATAKVLLAPVVKTLEAQLNALKMDTSCEEFINGKIEALENVIATLKTVRA